MTDDGMALLGLVEKAADADLVHDMPAFAAERILDAEVETLTGAAKAARSALRETHRIGCLERDRDARASRIELAIPRLRKGGCFPSVLEPRRTAVKALAAEIQGEAGKLAFRWTDRPPNDVSTRAVDDPVKVMGAGAMSRSAVSRLRAEIDERAPAFLQRPPEGAWPCLRLDAICIKVREGGLPSGP